MPKITYVQKQFREESLKLIRVANGIIVEYAEQGFDLTLRQLYYQLVSRTVIPKGMPGTPLKVATPA